MAQLGRFKSVMMWHGAHPRPQEHGRNGITTTRHSGLRASPAPLVHRTPLPALPSPGIPRFFLGIRKGDWEGLLGWEIIIFVCRYLPVVAEGLLLRKELWSHASVWICSIWASSQPWLCAGTQTPAALLHWRRAVQTPDLDCLSSLCLWLEWRLAEGRELPEGPLPCQSWGQRQV